MDVRRRVEKQLTDIAGKTVLLTIPVDPSHGDYTTSVALGLAKEMGKSPRDVAEELKNKITVDGIEKIEIAGPGFLNFFLSNDRLLARLHDKATAETPLAGKTIMVEFTDPNPFKELHIGHLYSNIVGESLSRLFESAGAAVTRVCYQGDVGLHVAKAVYGMTQKLKTENVELKTLEEKPLKERAKWLGEAYALGAAAYEEEEHAKQEIIALNKKIFAKDAEAMELYQTGRQWSLDYLETQYERLGTKFDKYFFESDVSERAVALVKEYLAKGLFVESQGAVIFKGEDYGLHTRVFLNSLGLPVYEAKELALAEAKNTYKAVDESVVVTANEINAYYKVVMTALAQIDPELEKKIKHIGHGFVRLPEGKMSSRTGNVLTAEWLLDEAKKEAAEKISALKTDEMADADRADIAEQVGTGAVKYALLKSSIGRDITFSFEESISFEGNAGPYLQYTYVRTRSVLAKSQNAVGELRMDGELTMEKEEELLLRKLVHFNDVRAEAVERLAPHLIATYLYELAQLFNLFYQKHQILKAEDDVKVFRLALTAKVGETIQSGLYLLGIQTPEHM